MTVVIQGERRQILSWAARLEGAPVLLDSGELYRPLRIDRVPWTLILDRDGSAREVIVGETDRERVGRALDRLN